MANVQHNSLTGADLHEAGPVTTDLDLTDQASDPATPASGHHAAYTKAGGLYVKDDAGTVVGPLVDAASSVSLGTPALTLGTTNAAGSGSTAVGTGATIAAFDATVPVTQAFGDAAGTGAAAVTARRDHKHGMPADPTGLPLALTGATAATRYVGGTTSGAPASGTFAVGDFIVDQSGSAWVCTVAGSPGTWVQMSGGGGMTNPMTTAGDIIVGGAGGTPTRLASPSDATKYLDGSGAYSVPAGSISLAPATVPEIASPATPAAGDVYLYAKTDGRIYSKGPGGVEYGPFDTAGGGPAVPTLAYVAGATWATNSDKFQGPSLGSQWTQVGSPTLTFVTPDVGYPTVAGGNCLDMGALASGTGIYQTVPATPWKAVLGFSFKHVVGGVLMFGLFAGSAATQFGPCYYNGTFYAPLGASSYGYNGTNSPSSVMGLYPLPQGYPGDGTTPSRVGVMLFRIGSTDNAALSMEASTDGGANWVTANASYATGITIDRVFIGSILGTGENPQLLFFNWE